ncbi:hypothetical protein BGW42_002643 [Actinomortierella wolfii]|nr:hypothetical protein BGW42_002643 [Actinomortierella wolfii]
MKFISSALLMLLCNIAAHAHFTVTYPPSRGFDDAKEPQAPCGSFNNVTNRVDFPLSNGFFEIDSGHVKADIVINLVLRENPTDADFTAAASTPAAKLSVSQPGANCLPVDLSSFAGAKDGVNGTLQIVYNGGDSPLYQCTDVVLKTNAPTWDASKCSKKPSSPPSTASNALSAMTSTLAGAIVLTTGILIL